MLLLVSGEANFIMKSTNLTVGGFTQPSVAKSLIETPTNTEKGFTHRFIWLFPNPLFKKFDTLGEVNQDFIEKLSTFFINMWTLLNLINTILNSFFIHTISHNVSGICCIYLFYKLMVLYSNTQVW